MNSPENTLKPEGCIDNTDANISANADNDNEKLDRDPNEIITVIESDNSTQGNLAEEAPSSAHKPSTSKQQSEQEQGSSKAMGYRYSHNNSNSEPECDTPPSLRQTSAANRGRHNPGIGHDGPGAVLGSGDTNLARNGRAIVDFGDDNSDYDEIEDIPQELSKVILAALFTTFGFLVTTVSLALTHDRMPDYPPLPDVILDNTPYQAWGLDASEYILIFLSLTAVTVIIFHKYRFIVLRRVFLMLGLLYLYRAICFYVTVLPKADPQYYCSPQLNHTITFVELMQRCIRIISGGGLSINGQQVFCGDFIYSGHTMAIFFSFFIIREYTPRRLWYLHGAVLVLAITGIVFLLLGRGHYTIDVIVAYFITSNTWWTYHSIAYNSRLHESGGHNFFTNHWWWRGFYYFEEKVPKRPLPWKYDLPVPDTVTQKFTELMSLTRRTPRDGYQEIV